MARNRCRRFPLPASLMAAPVLLALGGCVALPVAQLASPALGNSMMATAMQKIVPGITGSNASPCGSGQQANGCDGGAQPATNAADSQEVAATPQPASCPTGSDCDRSAMATVVHSLAQSLQRLSPGGLLQH